MRKSKGALARARKTAANAVRVRKLSASVGGGKTASPAEYRPYRGKRNRYHVPHSNKQEQERRVRQMVAS